MGIEEIKETWDGNVDDYVSEYQGAKKDIDFLLTALEEREKEIEGLQESLRIANREYFNADEEVERLKEVIKLGCQDDRNTCPYLIENIRLNALLTRAKECYEKWKDDPIDCEAFYEEAWQVIKEIGEGQYKDSSFNPNKPEGEF
jgi:hypothetical protein